MKSLVDKILFALAVTFLVALPVPVIGQIYTNVIGLPISQLPDIGTNQITSSDILPLSNLQNGTLKTVKITAYGLKTNFLASVATNLATLNGVVSTNPATVYNDILSGTNQALEAFNVGGDLANSATASNAVILAIGDSYTDGIGFPSPSALFGQRCRAIYGDDGQAGRIGGWGGGWANCVTPLSRTPPITIWPGGLIGQIIPSDGTNAIWGTQDTASGGQNGANATNYAQRVGVCFMATPMGNTFTVCVWSHSALVTNYYNVSDYAATPTYHLTNWAVPSARDWYIGCSSIGSGTNFIINCMFLGTNAGLQYWQYAFAGYNNNQLLSIGSNLWAQIEATINPDVILYSSIHLGTSGGDTSLATHTNLLAQLLQNAPAKTRVVVVGNPPNNGGDMRVINGYERLACQSFGWFYADLWSCFPSFVTSQNAGMFYSDNVHASLAGGYARAAALCRLMGVTVAGPVRLDLAQSAGRLPNGFESPATVTNNQVGNTLKDLTVVNSGSGQNCFTVNCQEYVNQDYYQQGGWLRVWNGSGLDMHFGAPITCNGGNITGIGNGYVNTLTAGTLTVTNSANIATNNVVNARASTLTVTNALTAGTVTVTNLCLAGQYASITPFTVPAGGTNYIACPAGQTLFVNWSSSRYVYAWMWTNGYAGAGTSNYIPVSGFPSFESVILKSGWSISFTDPSGFGAAGFYYSL